MNIFKDMSLKLKSMKGSKFDLTKEQAMELLTDESVKVLDVRTQEEIDKGEPLVEDAILIDYHSPDFKERLRELPIDDIYLVV